MPQFTYTAKDHASRLIAGQLDAENESAALHALDRRGYYPMSIAEVKASATATRGRWRRASRRIATRTLATFTRQLAELIGAGLPLLNALRLLAQQTTALHLRVIIEDLADQVRGGSSFTEALSRHHRAFAPLYVNLVHAGELSGALEDVLNRLADFAEAQDDLRMRLLMASAYPAMIIVIVMGAVAFLLTSVVPQVAVVFEEAGQALPLPTRIVMSMSAFLLHHGWVIVLSVVAGAIWIRRLRTTREGQLRIDRVLHRVPIIGELLRQAEIARMADALSMLVGHGSPLLDSIGVVAGGSSNELMRRDLEQVQLAVAGGASLAQSMSQGCYITPAVTSMVAVGEEGGALDTVLRKIAVTHEKHVDRMTKLLTTALEPLLILILGAVVAFIVSAMLLPIFEVGLMAG